MLKNIFTKIENKIFNFSQDENNIIENYIKDEIIVKNGDDFEINSKYKIGVLKIEKNFAILEDLLNPLNNRKLELDILNVAFNNELILAKIVLKPRSNIKAKVIKVLQGKKA